MFAKHESASRSGAVLAAALAVTYLAAAPMGWGFAAAAASEALPGTSNGIPGDLNGDGVVDVFDLLTLLANWG
jgi:hypothetical protein